MTPPLTIYRQWFESLTNPKLRTRVALHLRFFFPLWEHFDRTRENGANLANDVRDRLQELELELSVDSIRHEGAALSLIAITDLLVEEDLLTDHVAQFEFDKRTLATSNDSFLRKLAQDSILGYETRRHEEQELRETWRAIRGDALSARNLLAWRAEQQRIAINEAYPEVEAIAERMRRQRRGESDPN